MRLFKIADHHSYDKWFTITGPDELVLSVDYDDVPRDEVDAATKKMVAILNQHWEDHES